VKTGLCLLIATAAIAVSVACGVANGPATSTPSATVPSPSPSATATVAAPSVAPTATAQPAADEPLGFPIDPATRLGLVQGAPGSRTIAWGAGPDALSYTRDDQPSEDAERANRSGWDCRTHVEYEGRPAVDWYIPSGTPVVATMDGTATLYVITTTNAFDYYGVDREPYIGDPDRSRAPLSPFPGPGGGKGVFVEVAGDAFVAEYAHLDIAPTVARVPAGAFLPGYSAGFDFAAAFAPMRSYLDATPVARWAVRRGDVIGVSGDSGYSEAPHLHYTVRRAGSAALLCPTSEAGFPDSGWLLR
jgi:murein DD-endopeptidase MepM/ murein hydrolase activator NlpD